MEAKYQHGHTGATHNNGLCENNSFIFGMLVHEMSYPVYQGRAPLPLNASVAQLVECLPSTQNVTGSSPA